MASLALSFSTSFLWGQPLTLWPFGQGAGWSVKITRSRVFFWVDIFGWTFSAIRFWCLGKGERCLSKTPSPRMESDGEWGKENGECGKQLAFWCIATGWSWFSGNWFASFQWLWPTWPEDDKEGLLGYDDTAFYYFFSSVRAAQVLLWHSCASALGWFWEAPSRHILSKYNFRSCLHDPFLGKRLLNTWVQDFRSHSIFMVIL